MPNGRTGDGAGGGHGRQRASDDDVQSLRARCEQLERIVYARGGGGGGRGGGGDLDDGRKGKGGGKGGNGRREQERGRGGGAEARGKPGDWACLACGAYPCFARTSACYKCKAPRGHGDGAAGDARRTGADGLAREQRRTAYLGPVGAGGSKPMLGGRGGDCPSMRVPGASVAARSEAEGWRRRAAGAEPSVGSGGGSRTTGSGAAATATPAAANPVPVRNSWAALAEQDDDDDCGDAQACEVDEEGGDVHGGGHEGAGDGDGVHGAEGDGGGEHGCTGAAEEEPSEADLKRSWLSHCAVVRKLEKEQPPIPHGALAAVRAARDAAERTWRAARTPPPLHKRMRWAEADLRDAEAKERARRSELAEHLEQAARRTKEIEDRLATDVARTARKRQAVDALREEGGVPGCPAAERAARIAIDGIGTDIAPSLMAIIDRLGDGDEGVRQDLQLLSTSLGRLEGVLREGADKAMLDRQPARYDISDAATEERGLGIGGGGGGAGDDDEGRRARAATGGRAAPAAIAPRWTKTADGEPWKKNASSADAAAEARLLLQTRGGGQGGPSGAAAGPGGGVGGTAAVLAAGAGTNDLAEAQRRSEAAAQQQFLQAQLHQQQRLDEVQVQRDEAQRVQRTLQQQEEIRKHQLAFEQAAAALAAEEARQKAELVARMSPQELDRAAQLREQHNAVGAQVFGSAAASQAAGMVHQAHVRAAAEGVLGSAGQADVDSLMEMSPEDFARWEMEQQRSASGLGF